MNKTRRQAIASAVAKIEEAKDLLAVAAAIITGASEEEREYYDNMPEGLQGSEKGEIADAAATGLEEAANALTELDDTLQEALDQCENASA
jgi:hypothetical protein